MRHFLFLVAITLITVVVMSLSPETSMAQSYSCRSRTYYSYPSYSYYPSYGYSSYNYSYPSYSYYPAKEYKEEIRIKEIVIPSFLQIPLYGAYYNPPVSVPNTSGQPSTTFIPPNPLSGASTTPMPSPTVPATTMPPKASYSASNPCAESTARMDLLENKLNLILRSLENGRDYPHTPREDDSMPAPVKTPKTPKSPTPRTPPKTPPTPTPSTPATPKAPVPSKPAPAPSPSKESTSSTSSDDVEKVALQGVMNSCAKCHDSSTASTIGSKGKALGGGFVMVKDGRFNPDITDKQWIKTLGLLSIKKMPPETDQDDKPVSDLTQDQYGALNVYILRKTRSGT